jgi:ADP-ribose pyrophosphatase YjhB (NUDIX family)|uniref:Nudix hydrolase domain-containing protein n=1 Tax=viral metagenome TaxID=1070528 RepID=A0A6C0J3M1_9ZZZZ
MNDNYCNNCGKTGHVYHLCKMPITSIGIIAFRIFNNEIQYLTIRRKDTFGFIDFMRGKYTLYNKDYIINMLKQMTNIEKNYLLTITFTDLWKHIWGDNNISNQYKHEENGSREKFEQLKNGITIKNKTYSLATLIDDSNKYMKWEEPEWGFPKGRRNFQEKDFDCAMREFCEETGFDSKYLYNIRNIYPFEELFTGSNYKSYKHKYYIAYIPYEYSMNMNNFEVSEVSKMEWKTYDESISAMRPYNLEKKRLITNINKTLIQFPLSYI